MLDNENTVSYKNLKFEVVLFDFIEPLVALYKSGKTYYIASALPSDAGYVEKYLVVSVTPKIFKRYLREEYDLRYLFASAPHRKYFTLEAKMMGLTGAKVKSFNGEPTEEMLPDPQFFASSHTANYKEATQKHFALETLFIDGNWEMEDFGGFSRKYRDLYAFEESMEKLSSPSTVGTTKQKIRDAFIENTLNGGGSYVNLYSSLLKAHPREERYDLKSVQYASPGEINLQGKGQTFDTIEKRITDYLSNRTTIDTLYRNLHKFMSDSKLLDVSTVTPSISKPVYDRLHKETNELFSQLGLDLFETISELTQKNIANTSKVAMAIYRRTNSAAMYFAQGRVAYDR